MRPMKCTYFMKIVHCLDFACRTRLINIFLLLCTWMCEIRFCVVARPTRFSPKILYWYSMVHCPVIDGVMLHDLGLLLIQHLGTPPSDPHTWSAPDVKTM